MRHAKAQVSSRIGFHLEGERVSSWVSVPQFIDQHASSLYFGSELLGHTCLSPAAPQNCLSAGGEQQSFSIATPRVLQSNTQYSLHLNLYIGLTNFGNPPPGTSASGYIDPIVTIDPTFALADQFHLEFSAGVGNSAGVVPIPAALLSLPPASADGPARLA
jgi:hypothetical protein